MKKILSLLIICQLVLGCNLNDPKSEQGVNELQALETREEVDTLIKLESENPAKTDKCDCDLGENNKSYSTDLEFKNSDRFRIENDALFNEWSQPELVDQVKSILFVDYDTIPERFSIFNKVNRLSIQNRNGVYGLDVFPQLRTIHFFDAVINLGTNENWLNKIEAIYGQKTNFSGLESFTKTPNLRVLCMAYSGFEEFPEDFDKLQCLYELTLVAYMFGEIDLSELDLSRNKCLQQVEFHTWYNTLSGVPNGILDAKIKDVKVSHQKLTALEKEMLKKIK